jgi:hypothetical protein
MTIKAFWNRVKKLIKAHNMPQQQNPCLANSKCRFAGSAAAVFKLTVISLKQKSLSSHCQRRGAAACAAAVAAGSGAVGVYARCREAVVLDNPAATKL